MHFLIQKAANFCAVQHKDQFRKDGEPYLVHPFLVGYQIYKYHSNNPEIIASSLLHDILEDTKVDYQTLEAEFGEKIASIVQEVTEDKSKSWEIRKKLYIEKVVNGSEEAKIVSLSDKIHNLNNLLFDYEFMGEELWSHFTVSKKEKLWFEKEFYNNLSKVWDHPLLPEYKSLINKFRLVINN